MHLTPAEVAPAAPLIEAIPPLLILSGLVVALGLVVVLDGFVRGLLNTLAGLALHIPLIGGTITGTIHACERAISDALGTAIRGIQNSIAHQFHNLARVIDHFWHSLEHMAHILVALSKAMSGVALWNDIKHLLASLHHAINGVNKIVTRELTRTVHTTVKKIEALGHHVIPRLQAMEHAIEHTIPREIKATRHLAREAEAEAAKAWDWIKAHPGAAIEGTFAGAVAVALTSLGFGWLSCRSNPFNNNRNACSLWGTLGSLLGLAAFLTVAFDFREFVRDSHTAADFIGSSVREFEGVFPLSLPPLPPPQQ